jgi:hypothetical protein
LRPPILIFLIEFLVNGESLNDILPSVKRDLRDLQPNGKPIRRHLPAGREMKTQVYCIECGQDDTVQF